MICKRKSKKEVDEFVKEFDRLHDQEAKGFEDRCQRYRNKVRNRRTNRAKCGEQSIRKVNRIDLSGLQDLDTYFQGRQAKAHETEDDIVHI